MIFPLSAMKINMKKVLTQWKHYAKYQKHKDEWDSMPYPKKFTIYGAKKRLITIQFNKRYNADDWDHMRGIQEKIVGSFGIVRKWLHLKHSRGLDSGKTTFIDILSYQSKVNQMGPTFSPGANRTQDARAWFLFLLIIQVLHKSWKISEARWLLSNGSFL